MSPNDQTHFKNLVANVARFLKSVSDHFGTSCIKGLKHVLIYFHEKTHNMCNKIQPIETCLGLLSVCPQFTWSIQRSHSNF